LERQLPEIETCRAEWERLATRLVVEETDVAHGKMMSAPAVTQNGKVFAFFSTKGGIVGLGCRLGRTFEVASLGLAEWQHLAPFKTKPPMKDWIVAGPADASRWEELAETALAQARGKGKE